MPSSAYDVVIRPMLRADLPAVDTLPSAPSPAGVAHLLGTDPGGCWVAEDDGAVVGFVLSAVRETLWILVSYGVSRAHRGSGVARHLLDAAGGHARGCLRAMVTTPADPVLARLHHRAGFRLHPVMELSGVVDRAAVPRPDRVREGRPEDRDLLDSLARRTRHAAHGPDHDLIGAEHRLLVVDEPSGSGFAYVGEAGPVLLAATRRRTAADLAWAALAQVPTGASAVLPGITGANQWALDVGFAAGLDLRTRGYIGLRGLQPPTAYLHHHRML